MQVDEVVRVAGPWGQHYIAHWNAILLCPKVNVVVILEQLWQIEELRDQLFDIGRACQAVAPTSAYTVEQSIRMVYFPIL